MKKLTTSGEFLSSFGSEYIRNPRGICLDSAGRVYVSSSYGTSCVSVFEADGTHVFDIPENGIESTQKSQFESGSKPAYISPIKAQTGPSWGIAFDPSGNLNVACSSTNVKFSLTKVSMLIHTTATSLSLQALR